MKRLLDTPPSQDSTSSESAARHLLSAADPLARSAARKRHVWNAVATRAVGRPRFGAFLLAPAVLLVGASSLAAYQGVWPSTWIEALGVERSEAPPLAPSTDASATSASSTVASTPDAPTVVDVRPTEPSADTDAATSSKSRVAREARTSTAPTSRSSTTRAATAAPAADESRLLVEALQARRSGDHARAERLAEQYSRAAPRGALAEEALLVALEAAVARRDPRAERLARNYLEEHPQGRFRARAQRALAESQR